MASGQDDSMDFHRAFLAIDTDHSGEITVEELQSYCRKMNYQETFVQKWLMLFDADQNGRITYDEYCNALGLLPKKDVVAKHKAQKGKKAGKSARTVKVAKRRKEQEEVTTETLPSPTQEEPKEEVVQAASVAPVSAATVAAPADGPPTTSAPPKARVRNQPISSSGLMHFSRARMFQRKALYRLVKKSAGAKKSTSGKSTPKAAGAAAKTAQKPIGGEKNGGSRLVPRSRQPRSLPTEASPTIRRRRPNRSFSQQRRRLRASIRPGGVLILLAGRHRGKRVVFLRQLESGLLLVTGPLRANGCPLRRVSQSHVIATATRLELEDLHLPERINDLYFRRSRQQLAKKRSAEREAADPFAQHRAVYQLSQERREDQKLVDSQVMSAVRKLGNPESKLMFEYLGSQFSLKSGQKPHEMLF